MTSKRIALTASDAASLLSNCGVPSTQPAVLGLRGSPTCLALARLLLPRAPNLIPVVAAPTAAFDSAARQFFETHPHPSNPPVHAPPELPVRSAARYLASAAVSAGAPTLILPSTKVDAAAAAMGFATGKSGKGQKGARTLTHDLCHDQTKVLRQRESVVPWVEMLPPGLLSVVRPMLDVDPGILDATVLDQLGAEALGDSGGEVGRAKELFGSVDLGDAVAHGERRRVLLEELRKVSDGLLRDAVIDISHWGYVALCRETMSRAYADVEGGGRELACEVLARLVMHISGNDRALSFGMNRVQKMAAEMFGPSFVKDVPPGRTISGVLIRPANGPSSDTFHRQNQRRRGVYVQRRQHRNRHARGGSSGGGGRRDGGKSNSSYSQYAAPGSSERKDILVLSREPDRESSHLLVERMGGNMSALPLQLGREKTVYWDNRYVLSATPANDLKPDEAMVSDRDVLRAALSSPSPVDEEMFANAEFYVRQLRSSDWEYISASTDMSLLRNFRVPLQCIRGLPAIYQKQVGEAAAGVLAAVPHMGLSGRPDMIFTAVRLPRWRCIPADMEPGFQVVPDSLMGVGSNEMSGQNHRRAAA